jgi:hypothetical protein
VLLEKCPVCGSSAQTSLALATTANIIMLVPAWFSRTPACGVFVYVLIYTLSAPDNKNIDFRARLHKYCLVVCFKHAARRDCSFGFGE